MLRFAALLFAAVLGRPAYGEFASLPSSPTSRAAGADSLRQPPDGGPVTALARDTDGTLHAGANDGVFRAAPAGGNNTVTVLNTVRRTSDLGTIWRYYETWQSDVVRVDGRLLNVDIFDARRKADGAGGKPAWAIREAKRVLGSPFPPDDWRKPEFDDRTWVRHPGPFPNFYRSLALICLRGKFQVTDPSRVRALMLSVKFQGGVVAYLNGREVGRAGLPAGKIEETTLADAYPREAYVDANGQLIPTTTEYPGRVIGAGEDVRVSYSLKTQDMVNRFKQRGRALNVQIPSSLLKKGVNILAVEIHRAPADPVMFTTLDLSGGNNGGIPHCWNRGSPEDVKLTAVADAEAILPNVGRPEGLEVWTEGSLSEVGPLRCGDPNEAPGSIRLCGVKNGAYAGQVLVGSRKAIENLSATVSSLKRRNAIIPASAIQIAYPSVASDALESSPPAVISPPAQVDGVQVVHMGKTAAERVGVVQPIWVIVKVPRDALAGTYRGVLTVHVADERPIPVPIELNVVGDWVVPDPQNFTTFIGVLESADSVAMQYDVPLWSEEHWKHLDRIYELLGQIGTKDIYLTAVAKTHLANQESMVRWIRRADGTYRHDYSVLERYLDTALKHLGKVPVVCLYLHDYGFRIESSKMPPVVPVVTELETETGRLGEFTPPAWGTPEASTFWKPVIDDTREILAKRGVEKSLMFGMAANNWVQGQCCQDLKTMYPKILWVNRTHYYMPTVGDGKMTQPVGLCSTVGGVVNIFYDPEETGMRYGWRTRTHQGIIIDFPRLGNVPGAVFGGHLPTYRIFAEGVFLSGGARWKNSPSVQGAGHIGADFWPVLKDPRGGPPEQLSGRYVFWHSLSINQVIASILGAGTNGPVPTTRHQVMRESLQEAEARIFVQNALLDHADKLGPDLAKRSGELCDERTQILRYYSYYCEPLVLDDYAKVFDQERWDRLSEKLYQAASDVARALGRN